MTEFSDSTIDTLAERLAPRLVARLGSADGGPRSPWRDARGIAEHLDFDEKTIQNLTGPKATDPIPFHRLTPRGQKRFHVDEVDAWLRARAKRCGAPQAQRGIGKAQPLGRRPSEEREG